MVAIAAVSMCVMVSCGNKENKANDEKSTEENAETEQVTEDYEEDGDDGEAIPGVAMSRLLESAYEDLNALYSPSEDGLEGNLDMFGMYCTEGFNKLITDTRAADYKQALEEDRFFQGSELAMWSPWEDNGLSIDDINVEMNGDEYALDYLPRAEQGAPGSIKAFRIYLY